MKVRSFLELFQSIERRIMTMANLHDANGQATQEAGTKLECCSKAAAYLTAMTIVREEFERTE